MKCSKFILGGSLLTAVCLASACDSSNLSQASEDKGYAFTGETILQVRPYVTDPNLDSLVQITDSDLKAVLNFDTSKMNEMQKAELKVVNQNNQIVGSETVDVWIVPAEGPKVELTPPAEGVASQDVSMADYIHATMPQGDKTVALEWISSQRLGEAGYVLYRTDTGEPFNPGTPWLNGDYEFNVVVSDGIGLSVMAGPLKITVDSYMDPSSN